MNILSNLNKVVEFNVAGTDITFKIDFTDKRLTNKLLHLFKKMKEMDKVIEEKSAKIEEIADDFEKLLAMSDVENEILEEFKKDVDNAFGFNITDKMFGDTLPDAFRYTDLFDSILPFLAKVKEEEKSAFDAINEKYSIVSIPEGTDI